MFFGVGDRAALVLTAAAYLRSTPASQTPAMERLKHRSGVGGDPARNEKALRVQGFPVADL